MKPDPGTYALILQSDSTARVQIGHWGLLDLQPGYYIYIGSASGPGGVGARVSRHLRLAKAKHWHIDYLREYLTPQAVWVSYETEQLEHCWAQVFYNLPGLTPIQGFGCSDCKCYSHLFQTPKTPDFHLFASIAGGKVESYSY